MSNAELNRGYPRAARALLLATLASLATACRREPPSAAQGSGLGVTAVAFDALPADSQAALVRAATRAKRGVPGWQDQQRLAVVDTGRPLRHSALATITPVDDLERKRDEEFDRGYVLVAAITSDSAYPKLRLLPADSADENTLWLRRMSGNRWRARVRIPAGATPPPNQGRDSYFEVIRIPHVDKEVPGSARWIWRENDESAWVRCGNGCCELGALTSES